jgi:hypothetical protein
MSRNPLTQERVQQIASMVLGGQIGILEATFLILPLLHSDPSIVSEDGYNLFRGIGSETDDLPIGKVRGEWHPDVLPEKDREIARCDDLWGEQVRNACRRILLDGQQVQ